MSGFRIAVARIGYVGLSNELLLAQHNQVCALDIDTDHVAMVNARQYPIIDVESMIETAIARNLKVTLAIKPTVLADYIRASIFQVHGLWRSRVTSTCVTKRLAMTTRHLPVRFPFILKPGMSASKNGTQVQVPG